MCFEFGEAIFIIVQGVYTERQAVVWMSLTALTFFKYIYSETGRIGTNLQIDYISLGVHGNGFRTVKILYKGFLEKG